LSLHDFLRKPVQIDENRTPLAISDHSGTNPQEGGRGSWNPDSIHPQAGRTESLLDGGPDLVRGFTPDSGGFGTFTALPVDGSQGRSALSLGENKPVGGAADIVISESVLKAETLSRRAIWTP